MGIARPARLYRKDTGIFFVRVLIKAVDFESSQQRRNSRELRRSLQTKDPTIARSMSSYLNALLEGALGNERKSIVSQFFDHAVSTWTVPGILTVHGEDDHRRLMEMLTRFPVMQQALATRIATAAVPTMMMMMMPAPSAPPPQAAFSPIICDPSRITPGLNHRAHGRPFARGASVRLLPIARGALKTAARPKRPADQQKCRSWTGLPCANRRCPPHGRTLSVFAHLQWRRHRSCEYCCAGGTMRRCTSCRGSALKRKREIRERAMSYGLA